MARRLPTPSLAPGATASPLRTSAAAPLCGCPARPRAGSSRGVAIDARPRLAGVVRHHPRHPGHRRHRRRRARRRQVVFEARKSDQTNGTYEIVQVTLRRTADGNAANSNSIRNMASAFVGSGSKTFALPTAFAGRRRANRQRHDASGMQLDVHGGRGRGWHLGTFKASAPDESEAATVAAAEINGRPPTGPFCSTRRAPVAPEPAGRKPGAEALGPCGKRHRPIQLDQNGCRCFGQTGRGLSGARRHPPGCYRTL